MNSDWAILDLTINTTINVISQSMTETITIDYDDGTSEDKILTCICFIFFKYFLNYLFMFKY